MLYMTTRNDREVFTAQQVLQSLLLSSRTVQLQLRIRFPQEMPARTTLLYMQACSSVKMHMQQLTSRAAAQKLS